MIGALSKVLRLPLLQEFGRLRQNTDGVARKRKRTGMTRSRSTQDKHAQHKHQSSPAREGMITLITYPFMRLRPEHGPRATGDNQGRVEREIRYRGIL